jgi:hypothetical protein
MRNGVSQVPHRSLREMTGSTDPPSRAPAQPGCRNQPDSTPRNGSARYKNRRARWGAGVSPELGETRGSAPSRSHVRQHHDRSIAVTAVMSFCSDRQNELSRANADVGDVRDRCRCGQRRGIRTSVMSATAWLASMIKLVPGAPRCHIEACVALRSRRDRTHQTREPTAWTDAGGSGRP